MTSALRHAHRSFVVLAALSAAVALLCTLLVPAGRAEAAVRHPTPTARIPYAMEGLAAYVPANSCSPTSRPGSVKLAKLLVATYPNTYYGAYRDCGTSPNSEHKDGRAVDWMNTTRNKTQKAQGDMVAKWLLAKDPRGRAYANARRLGVMYIIWNNKIWGAYNAKAGWRTYNSCTSKAKKSRSYDTSCHRDHMHISLSWEGAMGRTSFWTGNVAARDYGRCRPKDMNWAYAYNKRNPNPCPRYARVTARSGSSKLFKALTTYSGRPFAYGSKGAGVKAVQQALGIAADGSFGASTRTAVRSYQSAHGIAVTGTVTYATWRSLLNANK